MKPLIKWAGGKSRMVPEIARALGTGGRLVEPFVGSGAVFLGMAIADSALEALLADVSPAVVTMHLAVRDRPDDLLAELRGLPCDRDWREHYPGVLDVFNLLLARDRNGGDPRVAARMLWLNRAAFKGLYRVNRGGKANMPASDAVEIKLPTEARIREVSDLLARAVIVLSDFRSTFQQVEEGDRVYCDPPYLPAGKSPAFVAYAAGGFTLRDHQELARLSLEAASRGARVVVTNADTTEARNLYRPRLGWDVRVLDAARAIGAGVSKAKPAASRASELLVSTGGAS